MQGEKENEDVVRERLQVSVQGVESVRCEGGRDWWNRQLASQVRNKIAKRRTEPFVVGLVQPLVANRVVLPPVNPINTVVGERQETVRREKLAKQARTKMTFPTHKNIEQKK